ncbi:MAG: hypothetical protein D6758_13845 [Gammaproteobacteria bacterium]|nr:MAG: hypothetical protein D6758_13845 [Gammaproteobacteria bacterium]
MSIIRILMFTAMLPATLARGELQSLDEAEMGEVTGQAGLSLEVNANIDIDAINYWDDSSGLSFRGVRISATDDASSGAAQDYEVAVTDTGGLYIPFTWTNNRFVISDISLSDHWDRSMGTFVADVNAAGRLYVEGYQGAGLKYSLDFALSDSRFTFRDQGNEFMLDGISGAMRAHDNLLVFAVDNNDPTGTPFLYMAFPRIQASWDVQAIRYGASQNALATPLGNGGQPLASYGGLHLDYDMSTVWRVHPGGRNGAGFTVDINTVLNQANFRYSDDGYALALNNISGQWYVNGLTLDVASDRQGDLGLALQLDRFKGNLSIDSITAGDPGRSFGQLDLAFDFRDAVFNGEAYTNRFFLQGKGHRDAGYQGLRIDAEWSLPAATISYTDDGNRVILAGIESWGRGDITFDVTRAGTVNGTEFFDGLRIGFEHLKAGYRIDGLKVGDENAKLQGGSELLLALELFPAYDFTLDGHYTLGPGGANGEGITVNADLFVTEGNAALMVDENGRGIWATGVEYDQHLRNMTIDVDAQGLMLVKGEAWSTMDISDLRIGGRSSDSIGRVVLKRFEKGSTASIRAGGAGELCVGASAADASGCLGAGGRWEDRGEQGVTIAIAQRFAPAESQDKRTQLMWETNRREQNGLRTNGSGTQLIIDDITTNDGVDGQNSYGFRNEISVDVYQTRVVKKQTGTDRNGVYGEKGQEKIMDPGSPQGYRYVTTSGPNDTSVAANRPLGFAVRARTSFKELAIGSVQLKHPDVSQAQTIMHGVRLQNFDIVSNLTATPID